MTWGEGEGWGHKIQPLQKALFVSFTAAGMCPRWDEGQQCHKHLLSLLHGKTSMDREFGSGNGMEAQV